MQTATLTGQCDTARSASTAGTEGSVEDGQGAFAVAGFALLRVSWIRRCAWCSCGTPQKLFVA